MPTLAMYDVMKIQDFVFNSNKTKENCGASIIVQKVFEDGFDKILKGNAFKDWKKPPLDFRMTLENPPDIEVIYIGGGNALIAFKDEKLAIETTQKLSQRVLEQSGGMLQFSVAYQDFDFNAAYDAVKEDLIKKLKMNKACRTYSYPMLGIGITKLGITDGLPAVNQDDKEFLSASAELKRSAFRNSSGYLTKKLSKSYDFETEFDKLGQKEGENYIAVVHIDGNNMGKTLEKLVTGTADVKEAVPMMREFSYKLDQTFVDVFITIVEKLKKNQSDPDFRNKFYIKDEDKLRIRPIVLNGDDVTFVCAGKLGITLAEHFLQELDKRSPMKLDVNNKDVPLSACAGVAIVKSHFPFYRAYELAEELCKSAKEKGKIVANKTKREVGSWIDYHIVYSGVTTRLSELREHAYKVPGLNDASPLEYTGSESKISTAQYNLLWRPWCVAGHVDPKYQWQNLKNIHDDFKKYWSRSRLKTLRNTMIKSEDDVESLLEHYGSRGYNLPKFQAADKPFPKNNQTPYFDALELLDFFVELKEEQGGEQ